MKLTNADKQAALAMASRVPHAGSVLELRAVGGAKLAGADLEQVLADAVAQKMVAVEMDVLAYEQGARNKDGTEILNRKGVRVRDGAMQSLSKSAVDAPFMRDHDQGNSLAKSGTIVASRLERDESNPGHVRMLQTVRLTEPAAVARAARGLIDAVSVGLNATGPVICTVHGTPVMGGDGGRDGCYCFPLDEVTDADGVKQTVQWEFQGAEQLELSECPIPAVQNAGVTSIRASLGLSIKENDMPNEPIPAPPPAPPAALVAPTKVQEQLEKTQAELAIAAAEQERSLKELAGFRETARQAEEDTFINNAQLSGRIAPVDEESWRVMFKADKDRAVELMEKRPVGCSTPVGVARQHVGAQTKKKAKPAVGPSEFASFVSERQRRAVLRSGMSEEQYFAALTKYEQMHAGVEQGDL